MHQSFKQWENWPKSTEHEALESLEKNLPISTPDLNRDETEMNTTEPLNPSFEDYEEEKKDSENPELIAKDISNKVSDTVLKKLSDDAYLEKFLHSRELRQDNQMLAAQVKHLLKETKRLESELANRGSQLGSYKQIAGNIYLKLD